VLTIFFDENENHKQTAIFFARCIQPTIKYRRKFALPHAAHWKAQVKEGERMELGDLRIHVV
jgi:hypothetical protein